MHHLMAKFWWILALRGALGILLGLASVVWILSLDQSCFDLFGMSLFFRHAMILATLILLLGLYAFIDGAFALILGFQDYGGGRRWRALIVEGFLSVGLGLWTWLNPYATVLVLLYWIAAWAVVTGFLEFLQGMQLTEYKDRRKPLLYAGLASMAFGFLILGFRSGGTRLVWLMGIYAFLSGIPLLMLGLRLRHFAHPRPFREGRPVMSRVIPAKKQGA